MTARSVRGSVEPELELELDAAGHGAPLFLAGREQPLLRGFHRGLVQAVGAIERSVDLDVRNLAIGLDNGVELHDTLDLRAHRFARVLRIDLTKRHGHRDTV